MFVVNMYYCFDLIDLLYTQRNVVTDLMKTNRAQMYITHKNLSKIDN